MFSGSYEMSKILEPEAEEHIGALEPTSRLTENPRSITHGPVSFSKSELRCLEDREVTYLRGWLGSLSEQSALESGMEYRRCAMRLNPYSFLLKCCPSGGILINLVCVKISCEKCTYLFLV